MPRVALLLSMQVADPIIPRFEGYFIFPCGAFCLFMGRAPHLHTAVTGLLQPLPSPSHTDTCSVYHLAFLHPLFVWSDHTIGLQIFLIKEREPGIQVALAAFLILEQKQTNWLSRSKSQNSCFAKGAAKSSVRPSRSWSTLALGSPQTND